MWTGSEVRLKGFVQVGADQWLQGGVLERILATLEDYLDEYTTYIHPSFALKYALHCKPCIRAVHSCLQCTTCQHEHKHTYNTSLCTDVGTHIPLCAVADVGTHIPPCAQDVGTHT